jgi:hypothetical protein
MKKLLLVIATIVTLSSCTPEEIELFKTLNPEQQQAVINSLWPPTGCVDAMKRVWPQSEWAWGERIMWRESRHTPTARNASGASGCWQIMLPLHSRRFYAVGCNPSQWTDPLCNAKVAYSLFQEVGRSPWNL